MNFVVVYNQLVSDNNDSHNIYAYDFEALINEETNTYPKHILSLPQFEESRLLVHVQVVPTEEKGNLESSILIIFYQLSERL